MAKEMVCPRCGERMRKLKQGYFYCVYCGVSYTKTSPQQVMKKRYGLKLGNQVLEKEVVE